MRDPEVERAPEDRAARVERAVVAEVLPEAERDRGEQEAAAPAAAVGHRLVAIGGRGVHAAANHTLDDRRLGTVSSPLDQQAAEFRAMRRQIEESILPLATSVDGRRFELQASLHGLELQVGGYLVLESDEEDGSAKSCRSSWLESMAPS